MAFAGSAAVWGLLACSLVVGFFGEILDLPSWMTGVSPFEHIPLVPSETVTATPLLTAVHVLNLIAVLTVGFRIFGIESWPRHRQTRLPVRRALYLLTR